MGPETESQKLEDMIKNPEEVLTKRKERVVDWLKEPNNLILTLILILAFSIRIYYYYLTKGQAMWWDEAEYMNMARAWAFGLEYEFNPVRPVLFSLIASLFYRMESGEFLIRVFVFSLSVISVCGMYLL